MADPSSTSSFRPGQAQRFMADAAVLKKLVSLGYASSGFLCVQISAVDKAGMELLGLPESADKATAAAWP